MNSQIITKSKTSNNIKNSRSVIKKYFRPLVLSSIASLFIACDYNPDIELESTGDYGNIRYRTTVPYNMENTELKEIPIITGYPQSIFLELTDQGDELIEEDKDYSWRHKMSPTTQGTTIEGDQFAMSFTINKEGSYSFFSYANDKLIDRISLSFKQPAGFEPVFWVRDPDNGSPDDFVKYYEGDFVHEGSQVTFLVIPLDINGNRMAGDMTIDHNITPNNLYVEGQGVMSLTENGVNENIVSDYSIYVIEEGLISIEFSDPVYGITHYADLNVIKRETWE